MSQFLPQEKLAEIQQASDIVRIISEYVLLRNVGKTHVGLCPFHNEKTPSFKVNSEKQFYKCFGCGESGSVFTFLMKHDGLKFPEAVRVLAEKANIDLPTSSGSTNANIESNAALYNINSHFGKFYHEKLINSSLAVMVRKYVASRGINEHSLKLFGIGYSLSSWDAALIEAKTRGFNIDMLENAGIVLKKQKGTGSYDRFRNRLMFPIFDETSRIIGFGARTLDDSQPKYLNSPESKIFNKRKVLYGLNFAKNSISKKQEAIFLEGYTDVIMAHQYGIDWSVGVMGTSLTIDHIKLIKRYCNRVVLILDADAAGIKSADKSACLFIENGFDVRIVQLPEGNDPCDFLTSNGKDEFLKLIEEGGDFFDFKMKIARMNGQLASVSEKAKVFKDIISTAAKIPDDLKRNVQIKDIADKIKIDESELRNYLQKNKELKINTVTNQPKSRFIRQDSRDNVTRNRFSNLRSKSASYHMESELIRLMLFDNKFIPAIKVEIGLENFTYEVLRDICQMVFKVYETNGSVVDKELFANFTDSKLHEALADISSVDPLYDDTDNVFEDCKQYIKKRSNKADIKKAKDRTINLDMQMSGEDNVANDDEMNTLLKEFHKKNKEFQFNKLDAKKRLHKLNNNNNVLV